MEVGGMAAIGGASASARSHIQEHVVLDAKTNELSPNGNPKRKSGAFGK